MPTARVDLLDLIRSIALLGMVTFHFSYDMIIFGLIEASYAASWWFYLHARIVAGAFIALAGLGLFLAHGTGIGWPSFWRRFAKIAAAAVLVTIATAYAMPDSYVYFGILHALALFSLAGLLVLRLPVLAILALICFFTTGSYWLQSTSFDPPLLRFIGLSTLPAYTVDFEPVFPWLGVFLAGVLIGKLGLAWGIWQRLQAIRLPLATTWAGRHSLMIYLIHQPVLMALVWSYAQLSA